MSNNSTFGDLVRIVYLDNDKLKKNIQKSFMCNTHFCCKNVTINVP